MTATTPTTTTPPTPTPVSGTGPPAGLDLPDAAVRRTGRPTPMVLRRLAVVCVVTAILAGLLIGLAALQRANRLVDAAVDFTVAYPEVNAVWGHRALKDAIDLDFPDGFTPGLETALTSRTWTGVRDDVDFRFLAWTVIWQVMGFAGTGLPCETGRAHSDDSPALAYFRAQLHELIDCRIRAPGHTG